MTLETPATIAILGAGPLGLEATLYARFLGFDALLLDPGQALADLRELIEPAAAIPRSRLSSTLGRAAIASHQEEQEEQETAADQQIDSGRAWWEAYFEPLAATDLVASSLRLDTRVNSISGELPQLQLDWTRQQQTESTELAIVIDTLGQHAGQPGVVELSCLQLAGSPLHEWESAFCQGLASIQQLFAALTGREGLDLYNTLDHLPGVGPDAE